MTRIVRIVKANGPIVAIFVAFFLLFLFQELPLPGLVSQGGTYTTLVTASVIFVAYFARKYLVRRIEEIGSLRKKRKQLTSLINEFNHFLSLFTFERVEKSLLSEEFVRRAEEPFSINVIKEILRVEFPKLSSNQANCIILFSLCYQWNLSKENVSFNTIKCYEHLDSYFKSTFTSLRYGAKTSEMARAYGNIRLSLEGNRMPLRKLQEIFRGSVEFREYKELIMDFTSKYAQQMLFHTLRAQKGEELRATITKLINEGKLTLYGIDRELNLKYQEELLRYASTTNLFLVFKNLHKELDGHIERFPQVRFRPYLTPMNIPHQKEMAPKVYTRIIKPPNPYPTATDFVNAEIRPYMKRDGGFVAVLPIDLKNSRMLPSQEDFEVESSFVSGNYKLVSYLMTGRDEPDIALWAMITGHISPQVLLSAIPFTILGEHLTKEENATLWENYARIKEDLGVAELTDWGKVDPSDLTDYLIAEIPGFDESARDRTLEISKSIVKDAQHIRAAMIPETYDILAPETSERSTT